MALGGMQSGNGAHHRGGLRRVQSLAHLPPRPNRWPPAKPPAGVRAPSGVWLRACLGRSWHTNVPGAGTVPGPPPQQCDRRAIPRPRRATGAQSPHSCAIPPLGRNRTRRRVRTRHNGRVLHQREGYGPHNDVNPGIPHLVRNRPEWRDDPASNTSLLSLSTFAVDIPTANVLKQSKRA